MFSPNPPSPFKLGGQPQIGDNYFILEYKQAVTPFGQPTELLTVAKRLKWYQKVWLLLTCPIQDIRKVLKTWQIT